MKTLGFNAPSLFVHALTLALVLVFAGCATYPKGSVEEYHRTTTVLMVTSKTDLTGIKSTGRTLRAEDATTSLSFPGFFSQESVRGLILSATPAEKP